MLGTRRSSRIGHLLLLALLLLPVVLLSLCSESCVIDEFFLLIFPPLPIRAHMRNEVDGMEESEGQVQYN